MKGLQPNQIPAPFQVGTAVIDEQEIYVPVLEIQTGTTPLQLTYFNTTLREFVWEPVFNHVELRAADGQLKGLVLPDEYFTQMKLLLYPVLKVPIVDDRSREWFFSTQATILEKELGEL